LAPQSLELLQACVGLFAHDPDCVQQVRPDRQSADVVQVSRQRVRPVW
jgi:hypothetical protein